MQRPHLDGSSSDSDNDQPSSTGATNFARTNIATSRHTNLRFNITQELERLNRDDIPGEKFELTHKEDQFCAIEPILYFAGFFDYLDMVFGNQRRGSYISCDK